MKKILLAFVAIVGVFFASCSNDKKVVVDIAELSEGDVVVIYQDPDMINARTSEQIATAKIKNGKCEIILDSLEFEGKIKECAITIVNQNKQFGASLPCIIEKGKTITITITGVGDYLARKNILNISYKGSKFAEDFSRFWKDVNDSFMELSRNNNDVKTFKKQVELYKSFIKKYPQSGYAYSVLISEMQTLQNADNPIMDYCRELSNEQTDNVWQKYLSQAYKYKIVQQTANSTLVFTALNQQGDTLTERDVKGELILVDFWASWCKPCLEALPKIEKVWEKYKGKGLSVVSISVDTNPNDWIKFIEKNPMKWTSLIGNGQEITQRYNFQYIPHLILADKNGKILQNGIDIEKLDELIEKNINK